MTCLKHNYTSLCNTVCNVENLHLSILQDRSIQVITEFLQQYHPELTKITTLYLMDLHQLLQLRLSECCFLYNKVIWKLENHEQLWLLYLNVTFKHLSTSL